MNINTIINELANKFGTTAQYLICEMQKYYIIKSSISSFVCLLIVIISAVAIKKLITKGIEMKKESEWSDWEMPLLWCILPGGFLLGCGLAFIFCIENLLTWIITPTASVLHKILEMVSR